MSEVEKVKSEDEEVKSEVEEVGSEGVEVKSEGVEEESKYVEVDVKFYHNNAISSDTVVVARSAVKLPGSEMLKTREQVEKKCYDDTIEELRRDGHEVAISCDETRLCTTIIGCAERECEMHCRSLLAEEKDSVMKLYADDEDADLAFYVCRRQMSSAKNAKAERKVVFTPLYKEIMGNKESKFFVDDAVAEAYREQRKIKPNVRMLVIDNLAAIKCKSFSLAVIVRLFCFFIPLTQDSLTALVYISTHYDYQVVPMEAIDDEKVSKEEAKTALMRLHLARRVNSVRRQFVRQINIRHHIPAFLQFIQVAFGARLLQRMQDCAPNIPQRLMLQIYVDEDGMVLDIDGHAAVTQSNLRVYIAELEEDCNKIRAQHAALKASGDSTRVVVAEKTLDDVERRKRVVEHAVSELKNIDPETQILVQLVLRGHYLNEGVDLTFFKVLDMEYDEIAKHISESTPESTPESTSTLKSTST